MPELYSEAFVLSFYVFLRDFHLKKSTQSSFYKRSALKRKTEIQGQRQIYAILKMSGVNTQTPM